MKIRKTTVNMVIRLKFTSEIKGIQHNIMNNINYNDTEITYTINTISTLFIPLTIFNDKILKLVQFRIYTYNIIILGMHL